MSSKSLFDLKNSEFKVFMQEPIPFTSDAPPQFVFFTVRKRFVAVEIVVRLQQVTVFIKSFADPTAWLIFFILDDLIKTIYGFFVGIEYFHINTICGIDNPFENYRIYFHCSTSMLILSG